MGEGLQTWLFLGPLLSFGGLVLFIWTAVSGETTVKRRRITRRSNPILFRLELFKILVLTAVCAFATVWMFVVGSR